MNLKAVIRSMTPTLIYETAHRLKVRSRQQAASESATTAEQATTPKSYNRINAEDAASLLDIAKARVLVVGANTGGDCREFVTLGAPEIHGLDVIPDVGAEFPHNRVTYHCQSIEKTNLPSETYDLIYSFATMEHVPDVAAGYTEMARLLKPNGFIYSMASPLWFSPYGHHMGCFSGHPWVHLVHNREGIIAYARANGIDGERGHSIEAIVDYMLDGRNFNMTPADQYDSAVKKLKNVTILENSLLREDADLLEHALGKRALSLGYTDADLLPVTHRFVARK